MISKTIEVQKKERLRALLLLAVTAFLWSIGGLLIKSVDAHPLAIAGARSIIAAIIIMLALKRPKFTFSFAQIGAALACTMTTILFVSANKTTSAANAILLQFTAPIYVILLGGWLLKEKIRLSDWITVIVVIGGMAMFFIESLGMTNIYGDIMAAASGVSFALFTIFMRMQKDGSPLESILLANLITSVIGIPFLSRSMPDPSGWLYLAILGVAQLGVPYILYSKAIKHATALDAVLVPVIEPLLNPVWVFLILGEAPGALALTGGVIVLVAITSRCAISTMDKKGSMPEERINITGGMENE